MTDPLIVLAAKHIAQAAHDWTDIEAGDHWHDLDCTNWRAWVYDAQSLIRGLDAALNEGKTP